MTILEKLDKIKTALEEARLGYVIERDEENRSIVVYCSTKHRSRQSGAVLQKALEAGVDIVGTRAGRQGFEIVVGA